MGRRKYVSEGRGYEWMNISPNSLAGMKLTMYRRVASNLPSSGALASHVLRLQVCVTMPRLRTWILIEGSAFHLVPLCSFCKCHCPPVRSPTEVYSCLDESLVILSFALCVFVSVAFICVGVGTGKLFEIVTDLVGKSSKVAKGAGEMAQSVTCFLTSIRTWG